MLRFEYGLKVAIEVSSRELLFLTIGLSAGTTAGYMTMVEIILYHPDEVFVVFVFVSWHWAPFTRQERM